MQASLKTVDKAFFSLSTVFLEFVGMNRCLLQLGLKTLARQGAKSSEDPNRTIVHDGTSEASNAVCERLSTS